MNEKTKITLLLMLVGWVVIAVVMWLFMAIIKYFH